MFNHPPDKPCSSGCGSGSFACSHQPWLRYDINQHAALLTNFDASSSSQGSRQSLHSMSSMDWTASHQQHQDLPSVYPSDAPIDSLDMVQPGTSVGRLVAHFENKVYPAFEAKSAVPRLPPRPSNSNGRPPPAAPSGPGFAPAACLGTIAPTSSFFHPNRTVTPLASPPDSNWPPFDVRSRVASPVTTSSPPTVAPYPSFSNKSSRVENADSDSADDHFQSLGSLITSSRLQSPMTLSPLPSSQLAPSSSLTTSSCTTPIMRLSGTPGFEIWRPPGPVSTASLPSPPANDMSSGDCFKLSGATTNKSDSQSESHFRPGATASLKGKERALAKPLKSESLPSMTTTPCREASTQPGRCRFTDAPSSSTASARRMQESATPRGQVGAARPSREQVPAEAWEQFKSTIRTLYLDERKPLKEVMAIMADKYQFQATPKMYKTRFSQWGFVKNNTEDEVKRLLSMKFQRDAEGKVSEFVRNGKVVNLGTYLKRKGVTEYDLIDFELPADLPAHVRCRTPTPPPTPGYMRSPDLLRAQELVVGNTRKAFLHCRQTEVESELHIGWPVTMVWGAGSSDLLLEANFFFEAGDADQGGNFLMRAFKQLETDLKKPSPLGVKELLLGMVHRDPGMMTALCKYLAAYSTTNLERSHPLRQIFTCLYEVQQKHGPSTLSKLIWGSIPTISEELEAIYGRRHPYVARTWIDLALFYHHVNTDRLEKLMLELRVQQRHLEQRLGPDSVEVLTIRYTILQLLYAIGPYSDSTKQAAVELWNHVKKLGLVYAVRDSKADVYCYHSPVKVDPWTKRCRRRYDTGVTIMEEHVGVRVHPYFEEDFHTTMHVPDAQEAWSTALNHMQPSKWAVI